MEIILADHSGFCFGVKRAIEMAEEKAKERKIACLGPLIHNPQEIGRLETLGIVTWDSVIDCVPHDDLRTVLIRTHGVGPQIGEDLKAKGWEVSDATCPHVRKAQELVKKAKEEGYSVVILGDRNHPEVQGLLAWTDNEAVIAANVQEIENIDLPDKVAVMAQTTEKEEKFLSLVSHLKNRVRDLRVLATICAATQERQRAAAGLAKKADLMIVVGGKNSSNTTKLWEICKKHCPESYLIENAEELKTSWLENKKTVGVTAGASTPAWIIKEVIERMQDYAETLKKEDCSSEEAVFDNKQSDKAEDAAGVGNDAAQVVPESPAVSEDPAPYEEAEDAAGKTGCTQNAAAENNDDQEPVDSSQPGEELPAAVREFQPGEIVTGTVVKVTPEEVLVDIGAKAEGIVPSNEISFRHVNPRDLFFEGQEIAVEVIKEDKEGNLILSYKRAVQNQALQRLRDAYEKGDIINAPVVEVVKGGLLVDVGLRGFVPASHISRTFVEDISQFLNSELRMKVIELDESKQKAVLSQKVVLEEEYQQKVDQLWNEIEEGDRRQGIVRRLTNFGAFVDIGGVDGLLHISEMSWGRIAHPSEVLKEGDEIEVELLRVDREKRKCSLTMKPFLKSPWELAREKYSENMVVKGKVTRLTPFGAFIEIAPGIEGLAHISQLATKRVNKAEEVVAVGQWVDAKIIEINADRKRIGLSLKEVVSDKEKAEYETYLENQEKDDTLTIGDLIKEAQEKK